MGAAGTVSLMWQRWGSGSIHVHVQFTHVVHFAVLEEKYLARGLGSDAPSWSCWRRSKMFPIKALGRLSSRRDSLFGLALFPATSALFEMGFESMASGLILAGVAAAWAKNCCIACPSWP